MLATISAVSAGAQTPSTEHAIWDALAETLHQSALIRRPGTQFTTDLKAALAQAPLATQLRWLEVLKSRMVLGGVSAPCGVCSSSDSLAFALGLPASSTCGSCTADLKTPADLLVSTALGVSKRAQLIGVPKGVGCKSALEGAFGTLCAVSSRITVIDRFAVTDAVRADGRRAGSAGLQRLLVLADGSGVKEMDVYVASGGTVNGRKTRPNDVPAMLQGLLPPMPNGAAVNVHVVPEGLARNLMHDRWLGFSWGGQGMTSWSLGKGLGQFDGHRTKQHYSLARQADGTVVQLKADLAGAVTLSVKVI